MNLSRFLRKSCPLLAVSLLVGCGDTSNSCPDEPYLPSFAVRTFNADTILLEISHAVDCPTETVDTLHVSMRLEGHAEMTDGSVDSLWFTFLTPGWIMDGARPTALLWATPKDDIAHLRGVKLNLFVDAKESGRIIGFEARQDTASY